MTPKNPYAKNSKIYNLFEQIKYDGILQYLLNDYGEYFCHNTFPSKGFNHLHKCVMKTGQYPFLNDYIDEYINLYPNEIDSVTEEGRTSLILASAHSNIKSSNETVEILLKHKANINAKDVYGCTALMYTSWHSNNFSTVKTVNILLKNNADVNMQSNLGLTALMISSDLNSFNTYKTIKKLLKYGADPNIQSKQGNIAIMYAMNTLFLNSIETPDILFYEGKPPNLEDDNFFIHYSYALNILLPNRKTFIKKMNDRRLLKTNFWIFKLMDCKNIYKVMTKFIEILCYM